MQEPNPDDMLERLSSRHLDEWAALFAIHAEEAALRQDGKTDDEIADLIADGICEDAETDDDLDA